METRIVKEKISHSELKEIAQAQFGDFVKAVVDIRQGVMGVGGELHADIETILSERVESKREDTWGINLYPAQTGDDFIEFDSMINIKPAYGNRSRDVEDPKIQTQIREIVERLVSK